MKLKHTLAILALASGMGLAHAGPLDKTECIAPAKPGGGFDLTCKLAQSGLLEGKYIKDPMRVTYMPGGIGAVAYNAVVAQRPAENNTIVAYSGGRAIVMQAHRGSHWFGPGQQGQPQFVGQNLYRRCQVERAVGRVGGDMHRGVA